MPTPQRLPIVNSDDGVWGDIIRQYIKKEHFDDGTDNAANGGHQHITLIASSGAAGTAPIKVAPGTVLSTPEQGAVEYDGYGFYVTLNTSGDQMRNYVANISPTVTDGGALMTYDPTGGGTGNKGVMNALANGSIGAKLTAYDNVGSTLPRWSNTSYEPTNTITANYTVPNDNTQSVILVNAASANVTVTLHDATTASATSATSKTYYIKRIDSSVNTCTIAAGSGDTIDGQTTILLEYQYDVIRIVSNGTNWFII